MPLAVSRSCPKPLAPLARSNSCWAAARASAIRPGTNSVNGGSTGKAGADVVATANHAATGPLHLLASCAEFSETRPESTVKISGPFESRARNIAPKLKLPAHVTHPPKACRVRAVWAPLGWYLEPVAGCWRKNAPRENLRLASRISDGGGAYPKARM